MRIHTSYIIQTITAALLLCKSFPSFQNRHHDYSSCAVFQIQGSAFYEVMSLNGQRKSRNATGGNDLHFRDLFPARDAGFKNSGCLVEWEGERACLVYKSLGFADEGEFLELRSGAVLSEISPLFRRYQFDRIFRSISRKTTIKPKITTTTTSSSSIHRTPQPQTPPPPQP